MKHKDEYTFYSKKHRKNYLTKVEITNCFPIYMLVDSKGKILDITPRNFKGGYIKKEDKILKI